MVDEITSVTPSVVGTTGWHTVTLIGTSLLYQSDVSVVLFGGAISLSVGAASTTQVVCQVPALSAGTVPVQIESQRYGPTFTTIDVVGASASEGEGECGLVLASRQNGPSTHC